MMKSTMVAAGLLAALGAAIGAAAIAEGADAAKAEHGKQIFEYQCSSCHGRGLGLFGVGTLPGTMALALKYKGVEPPVLEDRKDLSSDFVKTVVRKGIQAMPPYRKTEINDAELDDLAAYLTRAGR